MREEKSNGLLEGQDDPWSRTSKTNCIGCERSPPKESEKTMTISAAIKRLQYLEDVHGVDVEMGTLFVGPDATGAVEHVDSDVCVDVIKNESGKKVCAFMSRFHYEDKYAAKGIDFKRG